MNISGMMRDALAPTEGGLMRPSPAPVDTVGDDGAPLPRPMKSSSTQRYKRATVKERKEQREETRLETRTSEGKMISSDVKRRESVEEKVTTKDLETDDRGIRDLRQGEEREDAGSERPILEIEQESEEPGDADNADAVAKEIALDEREWNDEPGWDEISIPVVHRGSGRTFKSFGEMFEDPTAPMSPYAKTWEASACSPEEIVKSYGAITTLALKINRVAVEHRQEAASASWHALQCINRIHARLGDIVDSLWIERDRFVVIHIKDSEELKATGRIVIGPSGGYAYCFKASKSENLEYSEGYLGELFFPLAHDVETSSPSVGPESRRPRSLKTMRNAICEQTSVNGHSAPTRRATATPLGSKSSRKRLELWWHWSWHRRHDRRPPVAGARRLGRVLALPDRGRDELAQQIPGFGQRFVAAGAVRRAPSEIGEHHDMPSVLVAFDLGRIVVGVWHPFGPPGHFRRRGVQCVWNRGRGGCPPFDTPLRGYSG